MPRGADYDDGVPRSDNAIEAGETKAHGTGGQKDPELSRAGKVADLPEEMGGNNVMSGGGSRGVPESGSGKGGHEPKRTGEDKGMGALPGQVR